MRPMFAKRTDQRRIHRSAHEIMESHTGEVALLVIGAGAVIWFWVIGTGIPWIVQFGL